ncbi:MAG: butyrate kinase [Symbiobacteriaceae bacterium]|nr:butyrate kinase [Symbiobacteriaceae bacterium]
MSEKESRGAPQLILAVNPGSTSTKVALAEGGELCCEETLSHSSEELVNFNHYQEQLHFRIGVVEEFLSRQKVPTSQLAALVGRGGLLKPLHSGAYRVSEAMLQDLVSGKYGVHASNLGGQIVAALAAPHNLPALIIDPVSVDEFCPEARLSGLPELPRQSMVHALNTRAIAHRHAAVMGVTLDDLNVVVAHLGGGISIVPIRQGKMIDANNANQGGPLSPERAGTLPVYDLVRLCYSGKYNEKDMLRRVAGGGGLSAHLGENDLRKVEQRAADGEAQADAVLEAMYYQIAKEIGAMAVTLKGQCSAILLTGGMAYSQRLRSTLEQYLAWLAPIFPYPGEEELRALVEGAWRVLQGWEVINEY